MDENLMNKVISIAIQTAIDVYDEKKKDYINEQKQQNIQRIKKILKNYKIMKEYLDLNQDSMSNLEEETVEESADLNSRIPEVVKRFDHALSILKCIFEKAGKPEDIRSYAIIKELYLSKESAGKQVYLQGEDKISMIASKYNINKRTVYKDIDRASKMLSSLYFGIMD